MMKRDELAAVLDRELAVLDWEDSSNNGLQVEGNGEVRKVCCGVDASLSFFDRARERGADYLIVHHGISWGASLARITGLNYRLVKALMDGGMSLYACHLPLDAHAQLGNNAEICRVLGLQQREPFGAYHGREIGFRGRLAEPVSRAVFKELIAREIGPDARAMDCGPEMISTVGVVSGGAADLVSEAAACGLDAYVSGEATLMAYNMAEQLGVNAIFAGHYATERFGVKAVGGMLAENHGLDVEFIDMEIPY